MAVDQPFRLKGTKCRLGAVRFGSWSPAARPLTAGYIPDRPGSSASCKQSYVKFIPSVISSRTLNTPSRSSA